VSDAQVHNEADDQSGWTSKNEIRRMNRKNTQKPTCYSATNCNASNDTRLPEISLFGEEKVNDRAHSLQNHSCRARMMWESENSTWPADGVVVACFAPNEKATTALIIKPGTLPG
jgi:hypothetical protein